MRQQSGPGDYDCAPIQDDRKAGLVVVAKYRRTEWQEGYCEQEHEMA